MIKQTATYGVWTVNRHDDGKIEVLKNGIVCEKAKPALREIAEEIGFEINPDWTSQQLGVNVLKAMQGAGGAETAKPRPKAKEEVKKHAKEETLKEKQTAKSDNAELEAALTEIEKLKAEIKRLKAELAKANNSKDSQEEKKPKIKDPFDGLMVKVCAGMYYQDSYGSGHSYDYHPGGDKRRKLQTNHVDEKYSRRVTISKDYYICKYQITQAQWKAIMGEGFNPSKFKGDNLPIINISYDEIMQFIEKLNKLTGMGYRLPTEAEWTWAAMGASKDSDQGRYAGHSYDVANYAWYLVNSKYDLHPVGQKKPNELDLYDMSGNVWECCQDIYKRVLGDEDAVDPVEKGEGALTSQGEVVGILSIKET